jgi:hypothetical protein
MRAPDGPGGIHLRFSILPLCRRDRVLRKSGFSYAVHQGELIELVARVIAVGRTAMAVEVEMFAERLLSGERALCAGRAR